MIQLSSIGLLFKIGTIAIIISIIGFYYVNYNKLQNKNVELSNEIQEYKIEMEFQKNRIKKIEDNIKKQSDIRKELDNNIKKIEKEVQTVRDTVYEHDFTYIASKKPGLLKKAINNGTEEIIRCFELATGSESKENEKNSKCPSLIINN